MSPSRGATVAVAPRPHHRQRRSCTVSLRNGTRSSASAKNVEKPSSKQLHWTKNGMQCDHTSEMEVPGLIPGTDLRPADILTLWATPTPHWMCPSAPRTPRRLVLTARSPGSRPNLNTMALTWLFFFVRISPTPRSCGVLMGDLTPTR